MSHRDIEHSCNQISDVATQRSLKDVAFRNEKYFGDPNKNGSWCIYVEGSTGDLVTAKRAGGSWTEMNRVGAQG